MKSDRLELQSKIRSTIPLGEAMQFEIIELDTDSIRVHAPLKPNINIHGTGFAGSIYSLAVLTGWAMCMHIMSVYEMDGDLVVGKAQIKYRSAVTDDIDCRCSVSEVARQQFVELFRSSGKSKVELEINVGEKQNATLVAIYFAKT
ncbi:MAG: hypothetical protein GY763_01860 [Gammaproteobacteria bacterium]|nr:hypothetical protein [Gammaproteobacteria bacterium]